MKRGRPGKYAMCINDGKIYKSIADAANYYQISSSAVSLAIHEKRKCVKGLYFIEISGNESKSEIEEIRISFINKKFNFKLYPESR